MGEKINKKILNKIKKIYMSQIKKIKIFNKKIE